MGYTCARELKLQRVTRRRACLANVQLAIAIGVEIRKDHRHVPAVDTLPVSQEQRSRSERVVGLLGDDMLQSGFKVRLEVVLGDVRLHRLLGRHRCRHDCVVG